MKVRVKIKIIVISILILCCNLLAQSQKYELLLEANKSYEKGNYEQAIRNYIKISNYINNGYLFYNIGTCYLKLNRVGKALFYFEKAKFFIPLDKNLIKNNLIAKSRVKDNIPEKNIIYYLGNFFILTKIFSVRFLFYLSIFLFYCLLLFFVFLIFKKKKILFFISLVIFVFIFSNFLWSYYYLNILKFGYISKNNVSVFSDFSENAQELFKVNDGVKIYVLEKHHNFLYVLFSDGRKGWIQNNNAIYNLNDG